MSCKMAANNCRQDGFQYDGDTHSKFPAFAAGHFCPTYNKRYFLYALLYVLGHFINLTFIAVHRTCINSGTAPHNNALCRTISMY
jgi:hypothetical protein